MELINSAALSTGIIQAIYVGGIIFLVVSALLWFLLPFAVFGTKRKIDQLIEENQETNLKLQLLINEMKRGRKEPVNDPNVTQIRRRVGQ